jgi:hypothetical protein
MQVGVFVEIGYVARWLASLHRKSGGVVTTRPAGESFIGPRDGNPRRRSERVTPDTAVCVLLDVVLLGGAGSFWKAVICDVHAGIHQSKVATALVARNKALAAFRTLMKCRGGWDALLFLQRRRGSCKTQAWHDTAQYMRAARR